MRKGGKDNRFRIKQIPSLESAMGMAKFCLDRLLCHIVMSDSCSKSGSKRGPGLVGKFSTPGPVAACLKDHFHLHCSVIEASVAVRDNNSLLVTRLLDGLMKCNTIDGDSGAW